MKKETIAVLIVILATGFFLRLYPVFQNQRLLKYDSYYHLRVAELIKSSSSVPLTQPWPEDRPLLYPPGYHFILILVSFFTGGLYQAVRFTLPVLSSLLPLASFFFVRKFYNDQASLLTAFFIAVNPFLINVSYDSPQVINLFFLLPAVFYLLKDKFYFSSFFLGLMFLFNPFSALFFTFAILVFTIFTKFKDSWKILSFPIIFSLFWYLPRAGGLNNVIGAYFVSKTLNIMAFLNPFLVASVLSVIFVSKPKKIFEKFWFFWALFFFAFFCGAFFTSVHHPWRHDVFSAFGASFLAGTVFSRLKRSDWLKLLAFFCFILSFLGYSVVLYSSQAFHPVLREQDFYAMTFLNDSRVKVLSDHDFCATMLTLTEANCVLDLGFESFNDSRVYDYERFFWTNKPEQMKSVIDEGDFDFVVFSSNDWGAELLKYLEVNKTYVAFECWGDYCSKETSIFKVR